MGGMERSRYGAKGASTVPHIELDTGINAFYRREGEGPPLVLIMGTGLDHRCWDGQVKEYRRRYDCIRFDNRGTGRTDSTGGDLSMRLLADDTASLMDKLGIRRAHVSGLSLGSCVAQELALARPDLVETLQLHGTWGRAHGYAARKFAAQVQILKAFDLRAGYEINVLWFLTPDYMLRHPERVDSQIEAIVRSAPSRDDLVRLYTANLRHDALDRLHRIEAPTLITVGTFDLALPPMYAREVADAIPGSELVLFEGGGHLHNLENPEEFNAVSLDFLRRYTR